MPEWIKTTGLFLAVMICWDIARIFIQAHVNRKFMKQDFDEIDKALDNVEEAMEEE